MNKINILFITALTFCPSAFGMQEQTPQKPLTFTYSKVIKHIAAVAHDNRHLVQVHGKKAQLHCYCTGIGKKDGHSWRHPKYVTRAAFTPCSQYCATLCADKVIRLWRLEDGVCIKQHPANHIQNLYGQLAYSPHGSCLAYLDPENGFSFWSNEKKSPNLLAADGECYHMCFVANKKVAYSTYDEEQRTNKIVVLRVSPTAEPEAALHLKGTELCAMTNASKKPHVIVAAGGNSVWLWDTRQAPREQPLIHHEGITSIASGSHAQYLMVTASESDSAPNHALYLYQINTNVLPELTTAILLWRYQLDSPLPVTKLWWSSTNASIISADDADNVAFWRLLLPKQADGISKSKETITPQKLKKEKRKIAPKKESMRKKQRKKKRVSKKRKENGE